MIVALYLAGVVFGCCLVWLILVSTGIGRDGHDVSWRRVWLPILASTATAATFLMIRFVAVEGPVSPYVVMRGWLGFFFVFAAVFAVAAALVMAVMRRLRFSRSHGEHQPSAR